MNPFQRELVFALAIIPLVFSACWILQVPPVSLARTLTATTLLIAIGEVYAWLRRNSG